MKILVKPVGEMPYITDVKDDLDTYQFIVGGYIECVYLDGCVLVCDEEGKLKHKPINVYTPWNDPIVGTFFVCGVDGEDFSDIPYGLVEFCERYPWICG